MTPRPTLYRLALALVACCQCPALGAAEPADPVVRVEYKREGRTLAAQGRVLARDARGGVCLQTDEGELIIAQADEVVRTRELDETFAPVTAREMTQRLLKRLPDGFQVHETPHYLVAYSTSRDYARWTSSLLERLYRAFTNYWGREGLNLTEPEFPLVVVVHADRDAYRQATADDLGAAAGSIVGYYNLRTNHVSMYDITGAERVRAAAGRRTSMRDITRMLSRPAAVPLVATIVHEATHQIAFNCGLMTRYADLPLWLVEGMAVYFEAPDLNSTRGWQGIGRVNYPRLRVFQTNLPQWRAGDLRRLIKDDRQLRDPRTAGDAYATAWALNYFLIEYREDQYSDYVQAMSSKPAFREGKQGERVEQFEAYFGDVAELEQAFLERMARLE